jgi:hypothetical protein
MHACLLHVYDHALLHLLSIVIYHGGSVMASCTCNFIQTKTDFFVMLTSSVWLCCVLHFEAPEWFLVCWQIALYSYMSSHLALWP